MEETLESSGTISVLVLYLWYDCKDAGGRAMHGAIAEWVVDPRRLTILSTATEK